jgi:hypothetical protein
VASNLKLPVAFRNTRADSWTTRAGASALLKIYSGTQPTDADTALGAQTLLATLTCNATFAPAASGGVADAEFSIASGNAVATGTAAWFRLTKSDGTTVVCDGTVGTSGCDLNLVTTSITNTQPVQVTSFTITEGGA